MRISKFLITIIIVILIIFLVFWSFHVHLKKQKQPNVIFITLDSLRPDHLNCYGYKRNTSPNIDKLAKEGVIFTNAISQGGETLISVPSFITSVYPWMHLINHGEYRVYLNSTVNTLPGILKQNGYTTVLFNDYPAFFSRVGGIKKDFNNYVEIEQGQPGKLTQLALKWLKENKNKKFFLWLYYFGPHSPYGPSLPYSDIFYNDDLPKINKHLPIATDDEKENFGVIPNYIVENNITDVDYYIAQYDGKIRLVDEQIGLVLEELRRLDLNKKTLIVIIADHGESLGEHNLYFHHGPTLYDEILKVPFIISYPPLIPRNKIISGQVRLIDMMPTVLDILKVNEYKIMNIDGISLKRCILGKRCNTEQYAFSGKSMLCSIRSENWKLVFIDLKTIETTKFFRLANYYNDEYELYNLKEDPKELYNLVDKEKEIFDSLKQKLSKYVIKVKKQKTVLKRQIEKYYKKDRIMPLDEEAKGKLKNLGYTQ